MTSNHKSSQLSPRDGQQFEQLKPRSPGVFSQSIEREFSQIENDSIVDQERQRAIDVYYQMRVEERENPDLIRQRRQELIQKERQAQRRRAQQQRAMQRAQEMVQPKELPGEVSSDQPEAQHTEDFHRTVSEQLKIEAQQNVDYFCIKNEDNPKWNDQQSCQEFGMEALNFCKNRYKTTPNANFINCLKSRLKV